MKTFIPLLMTSINIRNVSATFGVKTKKAGMLNVFSLYLPTQSGDPHFLFELLNGFHVSYLLVLFNQNHMRSLGDIAKIWTFFQV